MYAYVKNPDTGSWKQKSDHIVDRREQLRVKLKSLAAEAQIIRREESRTDGPMRLELRAHRRGIVRSEARHTHLAYGFIRGLLLEQIEAKSHTAPDWERVRKMIKRYGPTGFAEPECMRPPAAPMLKAA